MLSVEASRIATSWSCRSQVTTGDQSPPLSSRHTPSDPFFTIRLTAGGFGLPGVIGGLKARPELGGGFGRPGYGLAPLETAWRLMTVVLFPDSKIAANTRVPSVAMPR